MNAKPEPDAWTIEEAAERLNADRVYLFDASPAPRYAKAHLPGAVNLDPGRFKEEELPPDKSATLLFYCLEASCGSSRAAARRAIRMGYESVHVMTDGIRGWVEAGLPVEP